MADFFAHSAGRAGRVYHHVRAQPSWITRIAAMAFLLIIALPIMLLVITATIIAVVIFGLLALGYKALTAIRGVLPRDDGRENVIVRRPSN